jgi:ribose-phosphate pyrophosphokinase
VVVATDIGITKRARDLAAGLDASLAIMEKRREGNTGKSETMNVIGEVTGKVALTVDDEIDTGGSLLSVVSALKKQGVKEIYSCCTHPIFSGSAVSKLAAAPIKEVVVTDTVPLNGEKKLGKITVLSIAPLLGEAIHRIHTGLSIGAMFQ